MEKYLMSPFTGSVDTEENWKAEQHLWPTAYTDEDGDLCHGLDPDDQQRQFDTLIEVVKDKDGAWVVKDEYEARRITREILEESIRKNSYSL